MNLHLFLDMVAWSGGITFPILSVLVLFCRYKIRKKCAVVWSREDEILLRFPLAFAALCWAWIVAG